MGETFFVESLALRRPTFSSRDLRRIWRRLRGARPASAARAVPEGVSVLSPKVLPFHEGLARPLNAILLKHTVRQWRKSGKHKVLWAYSPLTYGLAEEADLVVYHCVDLLGKVAGISESLIAREEQKLARTAQVAIASSAIVRSHLESAGFQETKLWPNVADVDQILEAQTKAKSREKNAAIFAGNITPGKINFELLHEVMEAGADLHLAGPVGEDGTRGRIELDKLIARGATYHGVLDYPSLSRLYWECSVGLIPYEINEYTRGVSPLKTFEYLAAGLEVVSTKIPSVIPVADDVHVARTEAEFSSLVQAALERSGEERTEARLRVALANSWTGRGTEARDLLTGLFRSAVEL